MFIILMIRVGDATYTVFERNTGVGSRREKLGVTPQSSVVSKGSRDAQSSGMVPQTRHVLY
ncbi:hypothetical protein ABD76_00180 [Paenibacillus dendritiformis]|nr:hypothetical protein [Paenibacillus dendritiformis]